jgi:carbon monoxide dehydrogenase subunit G
MSRMEVTADVWIDRDPDEVFAFVSEVSNNPRWQRGMREAHWTSASPTRVGSTYTQVASFLGRRIESRFEIIEYEPGRRIKGRTTVSTFPITFTRMVEPDGGGCRVRAIIEGDPTGVFKLGAPVMRRQVQRTVRQDYANLKQLLEVAG